MSTRHEFISVIACHENCAQKSPHRISNFISVSSGDTSHIKKLRGSSNPSSFYHCCIKHWNPPTEILIILKAEGLSCFYSTIFPTEAKYHCSQIHYASLNVNSRGRLVSLWLKRPLLLGKLSYSDLNPAQHCTGCSGSTWAQKDESKEMGARSSPAQTLPAALGAPLVDGK